MRTQRGRPLPELHGEELLRLLLASIEEEERLGEALGIDLAPQGPDPSHAPIAYPPPDVWFRRSEEVHAFLEQAHRAERARLGG